MPVTTRKCDNDPPPRPERTLKPFLSGLRPILLGAARMAVLTIIFPDPQQYAVLVSTSIGMVFIASGSAGLFGP